MLMVSLLVCLVFPGHYFKKTLALSGEGTFWWPEAMCDCSAALLCGGMLSFGTCGQNYLSRGSKRLIGIARYMCVHTIYCVYIYIYIYQYHMGSPPVPTTNADGFVAGLLSSAWSFPAIIKRLVFPSARLHKKRPSP